MHQTPSKMHMHDLVTIDTIDFKIDGRGAGFKAPPPPRIVKFLKYAKSLTVK